MTQDGDDEHGRRGVGVGHRDAFAGQDVEVQRQRPRRVEDGRGHAQGAAGGEHHGGGLADAPPDARTMPVPMPGRADRQDDAGDHLPAGAAQAEADLAVGARHGPDRLLARADDRRQDHERQRQRRRSGCDQPQPERDDEEHEAEQAEDDRGDAGQAVGPEADDPRSAGLRGCTRSGRWPCPRRSGRRSGRPRAVRTIVPTIIGKMPPARPMSTGIPVRNARSRTRQALRRG